MNTQHAIRTMQINGCTVIPLPNGTVAQHVLNQARRVLACNYLNFDKSLCAIPIGQYYIKLIDGYTYTVEPSGIITKHLKTTRYVVYPNGDAVNMALDGDTTEFIFDAVDKLPDSIYTTILDEATRVLAFNPMTAKDFISSYRLQCSTKSIDELVAHCNRRIDTINRWFITCTTIIRNENIKNTYIIKLILTDQANTMMRFCDATNYIIDKAMLEIAKIM